MTIDTEKGAAYIYDNPDPAIWGKTAQAVPPRTNSHGTQAFIVADVVAVNGKPAKGTMMRYLLHHCPYEADCAGNRDRNHR